MSRADQNSHINILIEKIGPKMGLACQGTFLIHFLIQLPFSSRRAESGIRDKTGKAGSLLTTGLQFPTADFSPIETASRSSLAGNFS
jgi:hypothetical protein